MAYELIWKDDEFVQGRNKQYILYRNGNDIKTKPKQTHIKCDSNIRNAMMTFRIPKINSIIECKIEDFIQIINNINNYYISKYLICNLKLINNDKYIDNIYIYLYNRKNIVIDIKYPLLFRNNYIYDEFGIHHDVSNIDKINIQYMINNGIYDSNLNIFTKNNENYYEIFFMLLK
jgi:hypothetical protein